MAQTNKPAKDPKHEEEAKETQKKQTGINPKNKAKTLKFNKGKSLNYGNLNKKGH